MSLDLVCTPVLISDMVWSRGYKLWCFQGRGINGSTDTLTSLSWVLGETGSGTLLVHVPISVQE